MLEQIRWAEGQNCYHCGYFKSYATKSAGVYRCAEPESRKDFTVTMRTVMERTKAPLNKWLMGFFMMCSSKKGVSAHQLHRSLGLPYQTAWFMAHHIRHAMSVGGLTMPTAPEPMGGAGKFVEADEPYFGKVEQVKPSAQRNLSFQVRSH
ncbi:transposase [Methylobacterium marchantiae]|uniref:Transposase n=1 Tax=Methylobacterium marchantiae TaxID=600331 RepID=A0ABW3X4W3_9HYPH|nr:IS1595 family transposase ISNwi1 [Methylobacterium marchantiae]